MSGIKHKIKEYRGIELFYDEQDGYIKFTFEGTERETKYVFEAERIIDEPVWTTCSLEGYFVDGYTDKYIGKAKATRKNIKNGEPYWKYKGQYDTDYKLPSISDRGRKTYLRNKHNDKIYREWEAQRIKYLEELSSLNEIVKKLR